MSTELNRRAFLKAAGAAVTVAATTNTFTKRATAAVGDKVRVGAIGVGSQNTFHLKGGLVGAKDIEVVAVCDVYRPHLDAAWDVTENNQGVKKYREHAEMLEKEELDAVIIATPLNTHYEITLDALDAGKHVFCEKTLCYTIDECRKLVEKCHETGLWIQVGHQRRYNPLYNKAMWLLWDESKPNPFGRIHHIHAQWHRNDNWRSRTADKKYQMDDIEKKHIPDLERHLNWRLFDEYSGGVMTELATHQTDVMEWFLRTPPSRVYASGGTDYWRDGRDCSDNVALIYEFDMKRRTPGHMKIERRRKEQKTTQINRDYTVRGVYTSTSANARMGATETLMGDKGTIELSELDARVFFEPAIQQEIAAKKKAAAAKAAPKSAADQAKAVAAQESYLPPEAFRAGLPLEVFEMMPAQAVADPKERFFALKNYVDTVQFNAFSDSIINGGVPKCNQVAALHTAISGLKGLEAIKQGGGMLEIDPDLYKFDFETPEIYGYDFFDGPIPGQSAKPAAGGSGSGGTSSI